MAAGETKWETGAADFSAGNSSGLMIHLNWHTETHKHRGDRGPGWEPKTVHKEKHAHRQVSRLRLSNHDSLVSSTRHPETKQGEATGRITKLAC